MIRYVEFPIIKRKGLSIVYYSQASLALEYIDNMTDYDINMIYENLNRFDYERKLVPYGYQEIIKFVQSHRKIYVYGRGKIGKGVSEYLKRNNLNFEKYVVTSNDENYEDTIEFKDIIDLPVKME